MLVPVTQTPTDLIAAVLDSLTSPLTRGAYRRELGRFTAFCAELGLDLSRSSVSLYRASLIAQGKGSSVINLAINAIRALVREASNQGCIDAGTAWSIMSVSGVKKQGRRTGTWLTLDEAKRLRDSPDTSTTIGKRDAVILGLLLGCGMRREEMLRVTISQYQYRDNHALLDSVEGKHHRVRTVPVPRWVATRIDEWVRASGITDGKLLRSVSHTGEVGDSLTDDGVWFIVRKYANKLGLKISPHDLRRTFAVLAKKGGADMMNLRDTLGHASAMTTESYIGASMILDNASCDRTGLDG